MKLIPIEQRKNLVCARCGETKSVKYEINGKHYCNWCILVYREEIESEGK